MAHRKDDVKLEKRFFDRVKFRGNPLKIGIIFSYH